MVTLSPKTVNRNYTNNCSIIIKCYLIICVNFVIEQHGGIAFFGWCSGKRKTRCIQVNFRTTNTSLLNYMLSKLLEFGWLRGTQLIRNCTDEIRAKTCSCHLIGCFCRAKGCNCHLIGYFCHAKTCNSP